MKEREAGIECLRIVSMLCIIANHFLLFTGALKDVIPFTFNYYLIWLLEAIGYIGVNCFGLISGYFLINSRCSLKKVFLLIGEVLFYSIVIFMGVSLLRINSYSYVDALKAVMPVSTRQYWFVTDYIALYCFMPFLNCGLKNLEKKQYRKLLCIFLILFSIWDIFPGEQINVQHGYSLYWLVALYCFGAYIRLYGGASSKKQAIKLYFVCIVMMWCSKVAISLVAKWVPQVETYSTIFYGHSSIFVFGSAVAMFILFKDIEVHNIMLKNIILKISASTFGVYIIHMNINLSNEYWRCITKYINVNKISYFVWWIMDTLVIYIVCTGIDIIRRNIVKQIKIKGIKS